MATPIFLKAQDTQVIPAGTTVYFSCRDVAFPATVNVVPGSGGTMSISGIAQVGLADPSTGTLEPWPSGTVSANASNTLWARYNYLAVTATTQPGTFSIAGA